MRTKTILLRCLATSLLAYGATAGAQSLTITNARILDGTGRVIEHGSLVVRDGKIAAVNAGPAAATVGRVIDAHGRTVMPGYIDAHRHLVKGNPNEWLEKSAPRELQEFLDAGFTTVLGALDPPQVIEARKRIEAGRMRGPRLFVAAIIPLAVALPAPPKAGASPWGDPARTDPARAPLGTQAAQAIPRDQMLRMI